VPCRFENETSPDSVPGITNDDRCKLEHSGVAVAVNHAARAAVANEFRLVELIDVGRFSTPIGGFDFRRFHCACWVSFLNDGQMLEKEDSDPGEPTASSG
jgi:hypothetical protein